jgi:hypothetical protein
MPQLFDQLRDFLAEVENEKQASVKKRAEANTETTAQGGPSTHPSKNQDDGTLPATEGKRSQENTSDVKDKVPTGGVDSAAEKAPAQADQQPNIGITSTATGEDPSNEDNYKEKKDDPGTSHAAKAGEGEKYSSLSFSELRKLASNKANDILSDIVKIAEEGEKKVDELKGNQHKLDVNNNGKIEGSDLAALREGKEESKEEEEKEEKEESKMAAAKAGQAAASLTEEQQAELVKNAHAAISSSIESTIADGLEKAAMVGAYLQSFYKAAAEGEAAGGEGEGQVSPEHESAEGPAEEAAEEGGMDIDPALLSQMAGEEAAPMGAVPAEAMGGAAPEGDAVQELLMALQEQGVDPSQLLQMVEGGEGAKMASAKSDPETVALVSLVKQAKASRDTQIKAGKFRVTEAKTAQQRALRDQIKACIRDIVG